MTTRLRTALAVLLGIVLAVAPAETAAVAETPAPVESSEPLAGATDPTIPRGLVPRAHYPVRAAAIGGPRPPAPPARPRGAEAIADPVPRYVRHCVWRE